MPILIAIGRWLLSGGWKYASMGLLALGLLFYRHGYHSEKAARHAEHQASVAAQALATVRQMQLNIATQAHGRAIATEVDTDHAKATLAADMAAERFIRDHAIGGLCPGHSGAASGTNPPAQGADPGVPQVAAAESIMVGVESGDVKACTADHEYAQSAYQWGRKLIQQGLGE